VFPADSPSRVFIEAGLCNLRPHVIGGFMAVRQYELHSFFTQPRYFLPVFAVVGSVAFAGIWCKIFLAPEWLIIPKNKGVYSHDHIKKRFGRTTGSIKEGSSHSRL
jgi:hypothetical protein